MVTALLYVEGVKRAYRAIERVEAECPGVRFTVNLDSTDGGQDRPIEIVAARPEDAADAVARLRPTETFGEMCGSLRRMAKILATPAEPQSPSTLEAWRAHLEHESRQLADHAEVPASLQAADEPAADQNDE